MGISYSRNVDSVGYSRLEARWPGQWLVGVRHKMRVLEGRVGQRAGMLGQRWLKEGYALYRAKCGRATGQ